jgi:hypothetical protein
MSEYSPDFGSVANAIDPLPYSPDRKGWADIDLVEHLPTGRDEPAGSINAYLVTAGRYYFDHVRGLQLVLNNQPGENPIIRANQVIPGKPEASDSMDTVDIVDGGWGDRDIFRPKLWANNTADYLKLIQTELADLDQESLYPFIYYYLNCHIAEACLTDGSSSLGETTRTSLYYPDPDMFEQTAGLIEESALVLGFLGNILDQNKNVQHKLGLTCNAETLGYAGLAELLRYSRKAVISYEQRLVATYKKDDGVSPLAAYAYLPPDLSKASTIEHGTDPRLPGNQGYNQAIFELLLGDTSPTLEQLALERENIDRRIERARFANLVVRELSHAEYQAGDGRG